MTPLDLEKMLRMKDAQDYRLKIDHAKAEATQSRHDAEIAVKEMGRVAGLLAYREIELSDLRTLIAGLECQKPVTCCSMGVCDGKDKGSTHWFIGCKAKCRDLLRSDWCLPCQYKENS